MPISCITRYPIGHVPERTAANDFVSATVVPHPDTGFVAVKLSTGKYRYVDNEGHVEDDRASPGAGERFVAGSSGTVIAFRPDGDPTKTPYVFPVQ